MWVVRLSIVDWVHSKTQTSMIFYKEFRLQEVAIPLGDGVVNSAPHRARVTHANFSRACGSRSHETQVFCLVHFLSESPKIIFDPSRMPCSARFCTHLPQLPKGGTSPHCIEEIKDNERK